jgi:probable HAF family extracellular repeat protein
MNKMLAAALLATAAGVAGVEAQPLYTATDIFTSYNCQYSGEGSPYNIIGASINDNGDVTGILDCIAYGIPFIYYHKQNVSVLPNLGDSVSASNAINNRDTITGTHGYTGDEGFVYSQGKITTITPIPSGGYGLNNRRAAVGVFNYDHAYKWADGKLTDLDPRLGGQGSLATAINDKGAIVGQSVALGAFLLTPTGHIIQLGTLGGSASYPTAINLHGDIAGEAPLADGTGHAFLWTHRHMIDLGTLPGQIASTAFGINNADQVVGASADDANNEAAFLWQDGTMYDLNTLIVPTDPSFGTVHLTQAYGVNNNGQIVAVGNYTSGLYAGETTTLILNPQPFGRKEGWRISNESALSGRVPICLPSTCCASQYGRKDPARMAGFGSIGK